MRLGTNEIPLPQWDLSFNPDLMGKPKKLNHVTFIRFKFFPLFKPFPRKVALDLERDMYRLVKTSLKKTFWSLYCFISKNKSATTFFILNKEFIHLITLAKWSIFNKELTSSHFDQATSQCYLVKQLLKSCIFLPIELSGQLHFWRWSFARLFGFLAIVI